MRRADTPPLPLARRIVALLVSAAMLVAGFASAGHGTGGCCAARADEARAHPGEHAHGPCPHGHGFGADDDRERSLPEPEETEREACALCVVASLAAAPTPPPPALPDAGPVLGRRLEVRLAPRLERRPRPESARGPPIVATA